MAIDVAIAISAYLALGGVVSGLASLELEAERWHYWLIVALCWPVFLILFLSARRD